MSFEDEGYFDPRPNGLSGTPAPTPDTTTSTTTTPYQYSIVQDDSPLAGIELEYQKLVRQHGPVQAKRLVTEWLQGEKL